MQVYVSLGFLLFFYEKKFMQPGRGYVFWPLYVALIGVVLLNHREM
jgi:hypothetical protein